MKSRRREGDREAAIDWSVGRKDRAAEGLR